MPWENYLIENKPIAICFQVVLEFVIFLVSTLLWLTWCTQHIKTLNQSESKSLAFALPGYLIGWICLMVTRLLGSRLKEKFCFSFYLASGVRFMFSAAILFPEFSREWYSVAYGIISLLCFVNTIFHIVTHPNIETRPVRRLIGPDGTLSDDPAMEMMSVKQLENYRDVIRNYMETHKKAPEIPPVRSLEVITVSLHGSTDGTSRTSGEWGPRTPWMTNDHQRINVKEVSPDTTSEYNASLYCHSFRSLNARNDGVVPGTTKRYSAVRVSQITIKSDSPPSSPDRDKPGNGIGDRRGSWRAENRRGTKSPSPGVADLRPGSRPENRGGTESPDRNLPTRIHFRGGLSIIDPPSSGTSTPNVSLQLREREAAQAAPLESNQLQRCHLRSTNTEEVGTSKEFTTAQIIKTLTKGVSRFSEDQIVDTLKSETRSYPQPTVKPASDSKTMADPLTAQEHHSAKAVPLESNHLQRCPHRSTKRRDVHTSTKPTTAPTVESVTRGASSNSKDRTFEALASDTRSYLHRTNHIPTHDTPPVIHRVTCPLHRRQKLGPPPDVETP